MKKLRLIAALFVFLISAGPLLIADKAAADSTSGLTVEVYTYDPSSTPDRKAYTLCATGWTYSPNLILM